MILLHNLTLLQPGIELLVFVWSEENWPPNWAWFLPRFFSPFCHRWSFGSLPLSPLACLVGVTSSTAISLTWLQIKTDTISTEQRWHNWIQWWTAFNYHFALLRHCFPNECCSVLWRNVFCLKHYINKGDWLIDWNTHTANVTSTLEINTSDIDISPLNTVNPLWNAYTRMLVSFYPVLMALSACP